MWFSFAGYLSLLSFGLLFEEMGLIIKYHGIVMKIKWASDLGRYIDRTINGTLKWSINLKKIYVSLIKLTFIRHLYGGPLPSALSILFMLMFIILWNIYLVVESLSCVWLFVTPWTAAHQAFLSFTVFQSLRKFMPPELVMPSNHLILCHPLLLLSSVFPSIKVF